MQVWLLSSVYRGFQRKKSKENKHYTRTKLKNIAVEVYGVNNIIEAIEEEGGDADLVKLMTEEEQTRKE